MSSAPAKPVPASLDTGARSAARLAAVQALYQMDMVGTELDDIVEEFVHHRFGQEIEGDTYNQADEAHFSDVIRGVVREQREIDVAINDALAKNWTLARLDATLRAVLRAGVYELRRCKDIPVKVVINEYVDVAHAFFEGDEPGVVNAVLDRLGGSLRK
ncbi:MAG: transcription antitermination factor NusB [Parvibaculum sp.]|uniref:transcription antitermination factor NusB n=1 Tax=Parvibaculum sp. TaxID=2024848 RepID=UPI0025D602CD|nr:transcription antitermination factor NusB [Parvibaculum sp.]MCE9650227.1 transcription antitermination factor NusB [Parvibaculum sp.]